MPKWLYWSSPSASKPEPSWRTVGRSRSCFAFMLVSRHREILASGQIIRSTWAILVKDENFETIREGSMAIVLRLLDSG